MRSYRDWEIQLDFGKYSSNFYYGQSNKWALKKRYIVYTVAISCTDFGWYTAISSAHIYNKYQYSGDLEKSQHYRVILEQVLLYWTLITKNLTYIHSVKVSYPHASLQREHCTNVSVFVIAMYITQRKIVSNIFICNQ